MDAHSEEFAAQTHDARNPRPLPRIDIVAPPALADEDHDFVPFAVHMLNQLRKWEYPFNGRDSVAFLKCVDDLCVRYGYSSEQLLKGLSELLRGDAVAWTRNNRDDWETWENFRNAFRLRYLPPRYLEELQRQIFDPATRKQKIHSFADNMMTLMRRAGGFTREQRLTRIYANMRPESKIYVKRRDVQNLNELIVNAAEFEGIEQE